MDNIVVSVICLAYNHEEYIEDALKGFAMQETQFPFEVIVHDDASTDGTANIIKKYEKKYPDLIKAIYQSNNQFSQKVSILRTFVYPIIRGNYIAFCEGDDYWTDPHKLQKQIEILNKHPEINACAHKTMILYDNKPEGYIAPRNIDCIIPVEDVIYGGGGFFSTNSMVYRTTSIINVSPMQKIIQLDYVNQIQGALYNGIIYLDDCMSAYRKLIKNSWTSRMSADIEKQKRHMERIEEMLYVLDDYTDKKYTNIINKKIRRNRFDLLETVGDYKSMLQKQYRDLLRDRSIKSIIRIYLKALIQR